VFLVRGNSVERCPACPICDIGDADDLQWSPVPNMNLCMYGYDPFEMDRFTKGKPDPGVRKRIFEPTKFSTERNRMVVNDFVDHGADINCNVQESTTVVNTMTDFMRTTSGNNIFEEYGSSSSSLSVPLFSLFVSYKREKSSRNSQRQESDFEKQSNFFEKNNGEAYINKAKCLVYRVSINQYAKAEFTVSFISALRQLQIAAKNPNKDISKRERINFIREFGTHYFDKCFLGASITTITRMSRRSYSLEEQNKRKNCVSTAYKESNSAEVRVNEFDVEGSVEKGPVSGSVSTTVGGWNSGSEDGFGDRSRQCDENSNSFSQSFQNSLRQSEVISLGALPFNDRDFWIRETQVNPSPADFRLVPIASLMKQNNLQDIPLDPNDEEGEKLDADLLRTYYQDTMDEYCDIMLGKPCPVVKSCHIWNDCNVGEKCEDDNSEKGFKCKKGSAILITGGAYSPSHMSAEIFLPWNSTSIALPPLPDPRWKHVQAGNLLCGGDAPSGSAVHDCLGWTRDWGTWFSPPIELSKPSIDSTVWSRNDIDNDIRSMIIMGGEKSAWVSEEVNETPEWSTTSSIELKYATWKACSISLDDEVVITGGRNFPKALTRVSRYDRDGVMRNMPSLNQGRYEHACASYFTLGEQVLMVTGGIREDRNHEEGENIILDSTELLKLASGIAWQEVTSARLPRPMNGMRVETVDNRVLLFGGERRIAHGGASADILEYTDDDGWRKIGTMKNERKDHATSKVDFEDFEGWIQSFYY